MNNEKLKKELQKSDHNFELLMMVLENNAILRTLVPMHANLLTMMEKGKKDKDHTQEILDNFHDSVNKNIDNFLEYIKSSETEK